MLPWLTMDLGHHTVTIIYMPDLIVIIFSWSADAGELCKVLGQRVRKRSKCRETLSHTVVQFVCASSI